MSNRPRVPPWNTERLESTAPRLEQSLNHAAAPVLVAEKHPKIAPNHGPYCRAPSIIPFIPSEKLLGLSTPKETANIKVFRPDGPLPRVPQFRIRSSYNQTIRVRGWCLHVDRNPPNASVPDSARATTQDLWAAWPSVLHCLRAGGVLTARAVALVAETLERHVPPRRALKQMQEVLTTALPVAAEEGEKMREVQNEGKTMDDIGMTGEKIKSRLGTRYDYMMFTFLPSGRSMSAQLLMDQ